MNKTHVRRAAVAIGLVSLTLPILAQVASAVPKARRSAIDNAIFISGLNQYEAYNIAYPGTLPTRTVTLNACGNAKIASSPSLPITGTTSLTINNLTFVVSSLPLIQETPTCKDGVSNIPGGSAIVRDTLGVVYIVNGGLGPGGSF